MVTVSRDFRGTVCSKIQFLIQKECQKLQQCSQFKGIVSRDFELLQIILILKNELLKMKYRS